MMKVYIAGKITNNHNYKFEFCEAELHLRQLGYNKVMNPAVLPAGFTHSEYMHICYAMIDVCHAVYFLDNWKDSVGAKLEHEYAKKHKKIIMYQDY